MKAVILAGGLGERLRPFTQAIPKPLLPIGEQSLLELQISNLRKHGVDEVFVATNYKSNYIKNFIGDGSRLGVKITFSEEQQPLGTCGPLSLLRDQLIDPFIMMNGDILTTLHFGQFYEYGLAQDSDLTVATKNIRTPFNFGSVESRGNQIVSVEEKPDFVMEIVAGIYLIKPALLALVPDNKAFGIDGLISLMLAEGRAVTRYLMEEFWLDIGAIEDYDNAEEAYRTHFDGS